MLQGISAKGVNHWRRCKNQACRFCALVDRNHWNTRTPGDEQHCRDCHKVLIRNRIDFDLVTPTGYTPSLPEMPPCRFGKPLCAAPLPV